VKSVSRYSNVAIWHAPDTEGVVEINVKVADSGNEFVDEAVVYGTKITVQR
jgi:hypothetical protein